MRNRMLLAVLVFGSVLAHAEVSGSWSVKINMDMSLVPAEKRAQAKAQLAKVKTIVTFAKDKTFVSTVTGSPDGKSYVTKGSWTQKGATVTMVSKTLNGKPYPATPPQTGTVSKDGKTITFVVPSPKGAKSAPAATLIFTKQ